MKERLKNNNILIYTVIFIITAVISFSCFMIYGKTFIWTADGFTQHYPLLIKLKTIVKMALTERSFSFWLDDVGIGTDFIGGMSIIATDPFNYIAAAFPVQYMDIGYTIACILRIYTAGLVMLLYLRSKGINKEGILVGAISYAFCSWSIGVINHEFFLLPLIIFPLVIWGVDNVFEKKSPALLIVGVALSLITYVYFAYMTAFSTFVYFIVKYFFDKDINRNIKSFMVILIKLMICIGIACLIASPVLVTMLYSIINASKSSGVTDSFLPSVAEIFTYIPSFASGTELSGNYSFICISASLTVLLPLVVKRGLKKFKVPAIMCLFNLIMAFIPLWGKLMNAFSYRVGRWCYALAFFYVYATVLIYSDTEKYEKKDIRLCYGWISLIIICTVITKSIFSFLTLGYVVVIMWNVFCMAVYLNYYSKGAKLKLALLIANIGINYILVFSPSCGGRISIYANVGRCFELYENSIVRVYPELAESDGDFFRIDYNEHTVPGEKTIWICTPSNENMYWNARGLTGYLSTFNEDMKVFSDGLLNSAGNYRRTCTYSFDNRTRLNYLMGVKYYLVEEESSNNYKRGKYSGHAYEKDSVIDGVVIKENKYDVGLGYVFYNTISKKDYEQFVPLAKEQILMQRAVVENGEKQIGEKLPVETEVNEVPYHFSENSEVDTDSNTFEVGPSNKTIVLELDEKYPKSDLFVEVKGMKKKLYSNSEWMDLTGKISRIDRLRYIIDNVSNTDNDGFEYYAAAGNIKKRVIMTDGDPQGRSELHDFMSNLGYFSKGKGRITLNFVKPGKYNFDSIKVYAVPYKSFDEQAKELSDNRFNVTAYKADHIVGDVDCKDNGILFFSIPYNPGWHIYLDGKETEVKKVDICYSGIEVSKGSHNVELIFRPMYFKYTLALFIVGISLLIVISIVYSIKKVKAGKQE